MIDRIIEYLELWEVKAGLSTKGKTLSELVSIECFRFQDFIFSPILLLSAIPEWAIGQPCFKIIATGIAGGLVSPIRAMLLAPP